MTRTVSLVFLLILGVSRGNGAMDGGKEFVLDFQNPKEVRARAIWNDPDRFNFTEQGFGWDGPNNASRNVMIESTTLLAVGWSWRPVHAVHVTAKIEPPGEFKFRGTSIAYPSGALYARYSPDAKHWSSWMNLQIQIPKDKDKPQQAYKGTLRVPYKEQEVYRKLLREYSRLDVPWSSDEEAAVEWMLKNDAELFQKSLPFIGYVQFLFEIHLRGGQRIRRIHISAGYGTGGLHSLPRDKDVKKTHSGPWRFKAERRESIEPATAADGEDAELSSAVREFTMKLNKATSIILVAALGLSLLTNAVLLLRTSILKSEYSWLRNTYEADIVGAYQSNGLWIAYKEHLEGKPKEYILDSEPPSMGIAVENFYSHKPAKTGNTNLIRRLLRVFDKSQKSEPERIWHTKLKNRWLEAYVKEHNATLSRLRAENPNQPLQ